MAGDKKNAVFYGTFIHSKKLDELEYLHKTAVFVDRDGKIVAVERDCDDLDTAAAAAVFSRLGWEADDVVTERIQEGQFFFPGFIGECSFPLVLPCSTPYPRFMLILRGKRHAPARLAVP